MCAALLTCLYTNSSRTQFADLNDVSNDEQCLRTTAEHARTARYQKEAIQIIPARVSCRWPADVPADSGFAGSHFRNPRLDRVLLTGIGVPSPQTRGYAYRSCGFRPDGDRSDFRPRGDTVPSLGVREDASWQDQRLPVPHSATAAAHRDFCQRFAIPMIAIVCAGNGRLLSRCNSGQI